MYSLRALINHNLTSGISENAGIILFFCFRHNEYFDEASHSSLEKIDCNTSCFLHWDVKS